MGAGELGARLIGVHQRVEGLAILRLVGVQNGSEALEVFNGSDVVTMLFGIDGMRVRSQAEIVDKWQVKMALRDGAWSQFGTWSHRIDWMSCCSSSSKSTS